MERLFIYGTLGPGRPNEHIMQRIGGTWKAGSIKGRIIKKGWGAEMGFPGLVVDEAGEDIKGHVFVSANLPQHWQFLDDFKGVEYQRTLTTVKLTEGGTTEAFVYALR